MSNRKKFDCMEFKRRSQDKIYGDIKKMTAEEEVAYFEGKALGGPLAGLWAKMCRSSKKAEGGLRRVSGQASQRG